MSADNRNQSPVQQIGEWWFTCRRNRKGSGFLAWCAKTPHLGESPLDPPGEVHFEFGETETAALARLKREVFH